MVRSLLLITCLCYTTLSLAQTSFSARLTNPNVELGKHTQLILTTPTSLPSLDTIDLSRLKSIFHINTLSDIEIKQGIQTWKLRLSPYKKGLQTLPALEFNQYKSAPIQFSVTDAIDPKSNKPLTVNYSISTENPWVRQQVLVIYTLRSSLKLYDLNLAEYNKPTSQIEMLTIQEVQHNDEYEYKTGYALFNLTAGQQTIELPPLVLRRDGTTSHRFYPPPYVFNAKPLPLYLPATVPVGILTLKTGKPYQFNLTHSLAQAEFDLIGKQIPSSTLPYLTNKFINTKSIQTYPDFKKKFIFKNITGLENRIHYTLPFKSTSQGLHSLKPIRLLNFDPERGILLATNYSLPNILSLNIWVSGLLIIILSLFIFFVIRILYTFIRRQIRFYRCHRQALQYLRSANDLDTIRLALNLTLQAEGQKQNISPQMWLKRYTPKSEFVDSLNQLFYHRRRDQNLTELAQRLSQTIQDRRSIFHFN